ncbi:nickel-type superoxide dismutase maturation protease [Streptomyces sp. NPDC051776]|uniref:nickel-type superoxide dismutase maturation protease n=1 Tax=Streptomyces sp. NPDC051776 TaxID=3155414 RepID=UPI00341B8FBF
MPEGGRWQGYEDGREPEQGRDRRSATPFGLADVVGPSMVPTLRPGDRLVVQYGAPVRPGDVIMLRHPMQQDLLIVKRAAERRDGGWWVLGDNPYAESDSREFGTVPEEFVLARARMRLRPPSVRNGQRSPVALLAWVFSAVRFVRSARPGRSGAPSSPRREARSSVSRRLRAR